MKHFEELEEFIKNENNWIEKLKKAPYSLKTIQQFPNNENWYLLVYNLFESDLSNPVVKQCRGSVVEVIENNGKREVKIICAPFLKFFNWNEEHSDFHKIDWKSAKIQEKCVSGDTIVETENGKKTIKEVVNGTDKLILSVNDETGELEFQEIENRWMKKIDNDWYEIVTESGKKLKITGNDRIKLLNGAYRRIDKLSIGEEIIVFER